MIKAKVIEIIDNRTLVLNVGKNKHIKIGMVFQIFKEAGKEIRDPESGEVLGSLKVPKIKVKVTHVDEKFAIAETYIFKEVNVGGVNTWSGTSNIFAPPKYIRKYETFELDEELKKEIKKERSIVNVGDIAEEITASEMTED